jgi:hypothetical protein
MSAARSGGRAVLALMLGLLSVSTMPVAVGATRYSGSYDLVHAAFAIPLGLVTGLLAVRLSSARGAILGRRGRGAQAAHALGLVGIWIAAAALVAVAFYGLLTYLGNQ